MQRLPLRPILGERPLERLPDRLVHGRAPQPSEPLRQLADAVVADQESHGTDAGYTQVFPRYTAADPNTSHRLTRTGCAGRGLQLPSKDLIQDLVSLDTCG